MTMDTVTRQLTRDLKLIEKNVTRRIPLWRRVASLVSPEYEAAENMNKNEAIRIYNDLEAAREALLDFEQLCDDKNIRKQNEEFIEGARAIVKRVDRLLTAVIHGTVPYKHRK